MESQEIKSTIFVSKKDGKHYVVDAKTLPGADCGSDHELLMMSMKLKIRNSTKYAEHPIRYDMIHIPEQFNVDIKNRFAELIPIVDEMTPNELWEKINITTAKVVIEKLSRKCFRKKQWISEETLNLIDERRNMKAHVKNVNNQDYEINPAPSEGHAGKIKNDTQKITVQQLWDCVSKGERVNYSRRYGHS